MSTFPALLQLDEVVNNLLFTTNSEPPVTTVEVKINGHTVIFKTRLTTVQDLHKFTHRPPPPPPSKEAQHFKLPERDRD